MGMHGNADEGLENNFVRYEHLLQILPDLKCLEAFPQGSFPSVMLAGRSCCWLR